jgi:hypothetical protein
MMLTFPTFGSPTIAVCNFMVRRVDEYERAVDIRVDAARKLERPEPKAATDRVVVAKQSIKQTMVDDVDLEAS